DNDHIAWDFVLGGGEACSICGQELAAFIQPASFPFTVQRCWSNARAAAGHDPCVPAPSGAVYFNAAPVLEDVIPVNALTTLGVHIPLGQSRTIPVDLFSDGPTGQPIVVQAFDGNVLTGGTAQLALSLDTDRGLNGQHLNLTITVMSAPAFRAETFFLTVKVG